MSRHTNIAEIERLKTMLVTLFRNLGLTHREIELPINAPNGYWSKVMSGERDFRLEHVLEFAEATGMEPAEFFLMAYVAYADRPLSATARRYLVQRSAGNGDPLETIARFRGAKTIGEALSLPGPSERWLSEVQKLREEIRILRGALAPDSEAAAKLAALDEEPPVELPAPEMPPRRKRGRPPKNAVRQAS